MTCPSPPTQGPSRRNHYVPEWYQAGFGIAGADNWLLDISTPQLRPDGKPIPCVPRQWPPKYCFWEKDLYITRLGEQVNDQIETVLFQGIDDFGANAVRAFILGDAAEMHQNLAPLFAYLSAQKLRTPKGLDWIRSRYPALSQLELMVELQHLRQMFGALWAESVREIVCAKDAGVKFLVTDHPVTTFNAALPDDAPQMSYPHDAPITWNGSQTLFPLDANHLLILTHVPYAKAPDAVEAAGKRINARHFGNSLIHAGALIRSRQFDTDAVIAVNAWLKSRARRYIAAGQREWLFPECARSVERNQLAQLLLPPEDELWHFGGEIHIGYKDGTYGYRDEYGRTSREHEFVAKVAPAAPPATEAPCPCGSGEAFGACCLHRPPWERAPWDVLSLRERNLGFIRAAMGVLGLDQGMSWTTVQRELTDEQVARLHRIAQGLWPEGTDLAALLPRPEERRTRAVYMGPSDPRTVGESVIALAPLFDQILVMDPFLSSRNIRPEYSPVTVPAQFKQQFLKNVMFWLTLAPMIEAGKVVVFPDPGDLSPEFGYAMRNMALERTAEWRIAMDPAEIDELRWLGRDDFERSLLQLPDETLLPMFSKSSPELSEAQVRDAIAYMRSKREGDPFALLQTLGVGEQFAQYLVIRCVNLEVALFIAQSTGAVIVTDVRALWSHLHLHTRAACPNGEATVPPSEPLRFRAPLNPFDALAVAEMPSAAAARDALRDLQAVADRHMLDASTEEKLRTLHARADGVAVDAEGLTNPELQVTVALTPSIPPSGFESPTAQRLVVGFGRDDAPVFLGLAFFRQTEGNIHAVAPDPAD